MERIIKTIMNNHADDSHLSVSRAIWKRAEKWQATSIKISLYSAFLPEIHVRICLFL